MLILLGAPGWLSLIMAMLFLVAYRAWLGLRRRAATVTFDVIAEQLADAVRRYWLHEVRSRGLNSPYPMPVRWAAANAAVSDHFVGVSPADISSTLRVEGQSGDIAHFFAQLPSHRLVVLGPPGSGKTVLTMQLVLSLLEVRSSDDPVPVLLPISTWDPSTQSYQGWLVERLTVDYPSLARLLPSGESAADLLVRNGRILPVVDGLDELPQRHRAVALQEFNASLTAQDALVLTCRSDEFSALVVSTGVVLARAAVVELQPLQPTTVLDYLRFSVPPRREESIAYVLGEHMNDPMHNPLTRVLTSPLMVELFRIAYEDPRRDPRELLDQSRFPDAASIEDWLLQSFVAHTVSRRSAWGTDLSHVERWLSFLAADLLRSGRRELSWWELEKSAPSWVSTCAGTVLVSAGAGAAVMTQYGPFPGLVAAVVSAAGAACLGFLLKRRTRGGVRAESFPSLGRRVAARALLVGLTACAPLGLATARTTGWEAGASVAAGLFASISVTAWLTHHDSEVHPSAPRATVHASVLLAISSWLALALSLATTWYLGAHRLGTDDVTVALVAAAATLPWLTNATAWGRFAAARVWLASCGLLPWRFLRFLEEMWRMGLIRRSGASYQFAHARLLEVLAHRYDQPRLTEGATGR
ncbi:NACHT domain-containing protein [Streptomyces collinus]|uniref:NACHT domain-containing protein n=1 Tax=Streptomyces collinus TaxID=42684 RepID=UPI0038227670